MKIIEAAQAHQALLSLKEKEVNYDFAVAILQAIRETTAPAEVFAKGEINLVEKYAKRDDAGNIIWTDERTFSFQNNEDAQKYNKAKQELLETEVLTDFKPYKVNAPVNISPSILEAISSVINFKE